MVNSGHEEESPREAASPKAGAFQSGAKEGLECEAKKEIVVTDEMLHAGLRMVSLRSNPYLAPSNLSASDLKAVYISMRQLDSST